MPRKSAAHTANIEVVALQGPITVAYRKQRGLWHCTALQFDITGVGDTKDAAFNEMRALLGDYLDEVLQSDEPVQFFHPADTVDWNSRVQEHYRLTVLLANQPRRSENYGRLHVPLQQFMRFRKYRDSVHGIDLVPAGA